MSEEKHGTESKKERKAEMEKTAAKLGWLQRQLKEAKIPVLITFDGLDAAGKGLQINRLIQALDPRGFDVYTGDRDGEEERMHPFLWRFATKTPANGRITIFDTSWYRHVQQDYFDGMTKEKDLDEAFTDILAFEKYLVDNGVLLIKFFLTIPEKEQKKRFDKLEQSEETAWRVTEADRARNREYKKYKKINEEMISRTSWIGAPWHTVDSTKKDAAALAIMNTVNRCMEQALEEKKRVKEPGIYEGPLPPDRYKKGILVKTDLSKTLEQKEYREKLDKLQKKAENCTASFTA